MKSTSNMGTEKISKLLLQFSIPSVIGMMVNAIYNIVDRIFIGNSPNGDLGIAALTICFPLMMLVFSISALFAMGGATMFSIRLGQQKIEDARKYLGNTFVLLFLSGILMTVIGLYFLEPILNLLGADAKILPYSIDYLQIILLGCVLSTVSFGGTAFMRADGAPTRAMIAMLSGAIFNIIFDYLFIWRFGWGIHGAALATVGGQMLSTGFVVWYFLFSSKCQVRLQLPALKLKRVLIKNVVSNGIPMFVTQFTAAITITILNNSLSYYGGLTGINSEIAISGMGIINSLQTIIFMPILGIVQGAAPLISFNYGARQLHRSHEALKLAMIVSTLIALFGTLFFFWKAEFLVSLFNSNPELVAFSSHALTIWFLGFPLVGIQVLGANYFQATRQPLMATLLNLSRQVLILIPLVLILPRFFSLNGILYAAPLSDTLSTLVTAVFLWRALVSIPHQNQSHNPSV